MQDLYSYKQIFSFRVQGICDSTLRFRDVECKWPGSGHNAEGFSNYKIDENLQIKRTKH